MLYGPGSLILTMTLIGKVLNQIFQFTKIIATVMIIHSVLCSQSISFKHQFLL
ncbi:MAG: hypothetical protein ACJAWQ_002653 [Paraglaciecola sp.]|jgi:hypothetical protein